MSSDGSYEIRDKSNRKLLRVLVVFMKNAVYVLESVEHLAKFELVNVLTNNTPADSVRRFREYFRVQLIKPTSERIDPGCLKADRFQPVCSHPECLVEVEDDTVKPRLTDPRLADNLS